MITVCSVASRQMTCNNNSGTDDDNLEPQITKQGVSKRRRRIAARGTDFLIVILYSSHL